MTASDALSTVAIVVSLVTFFFTAYEQYWKKPVLSLVPGDRVSLSYGPGYSGISLWAFVVLANQGAEDAVILGMTGTLATADGTWRSELTWQALGKYEDRAPPGQPSFAPVDWAEALISASRKASANWISFTGSVPGKLPSGSYSLRLDVITQRKRRRLGLRPLTGRPCATGRTRSRTACSWTGSFQISADGLGHLEERCVATDQGTVTAAYTVCLTGQTTRLPLVSPATPTLTPGASPQAGSSPQAGASPQA